MVLSLVKKIFNSIALVPSLLALSFLALAIILTKLDLDYGRYGITRFLIIDKKEDIQAILAFVIGGIFTLTVFSYTMVMNVLNRSINNYSPRLVPLLLTEKHHQIILGVSSGTILYCLTLSIDLYNTAIAIILTIGCVLLFIYFIHTVSQSIHVNYILYKVYERTKSSLEKKSKSLSNFNITDNSPKDAFAHAHGSVGYLHSYDIPKLESFALKQELKLRIEKVPGSFVYSHENLVTCDKELNKKLKLKLERFLAIDKEVPLDVPEIGFKHLVEVAVKAASPAINDPGTSKSCIDYLTELFIIRIQKCKVSEWMENTKAQLLIRNLGNRELLENCYREMYGYMKNDALLPKVLERSLKTINEQTGIDVKDMLLEFRPD